jgi:uncharacterized linocin/CFP29 family protein
MNHLMRDLAPISEESWNQIDAEAARSLKHFLAARKLVDFTGPLGWDRSGIDSGRTDQLESGPLGPVEAALRKVHPLIELRSPFTLSRSELADADRGANDLDLDPVIAAARVAALAEDHLVFNGHVQGVVTGMIAASPHSPVTITDDYSHYPSHVAKAVALLRTTGIAGPYAIALGSRCYTGVIETTEHGGYPVFEHLHQILEGPVVWAPAVDGAVVLSQRGGDFELTLGQDFSLGYRSDDADAVDLFIEESVSFRVNTPEAAVHLTHT